DFARYVARDMDAWEFLVYTRCRHVAGDAEVGEAALAALGAAYRELPGRRFGAAAEPFADAVRAMRDRLADSIRVGQGTIETKRRHGGLVDLEFATELAIASCLAEGTTRGATGGTLMPDGEHVRGRLAAWIGEHDAR